ncbi:fumarylacetoacetase [Roseibaca sp. V10]|uniref:fumarylacetoacetase n=1 Tax=Roseinatronobacter domitianus TaxID=2940293 RepID=A0ABT0LZ32_9RHOB|nr:fumarylacetoacetase [Roseibaca domitiana]MCL1627858.1 fumarylacetoacetase [Roseibaca domitiana]
MGLRQSWVGSANEPGCDFPLNNLALGVFDAGHGRRCGVAIGDQIADATALEAAGLLSLGTPLLTHPSWNALMAAGPTIWADFRVQMTDLLRAGAPAQAKVAPHLHAMQGATLHLPFTVSEFTDFYAGRHHATNVGTMFRGADNALPANWLHIPIGYNGRASSVVVSGTPVRRPWGQVKGPDDNVPRFTPSQRFDFELELGAIIAQPSNGPVSVAQANDMIFGYVLLNDWSARDIQAWEYQPLGPFQSKATATTISPWIVMRAALDPFCAAPPDRETPLLPHLADSGDDFHDIALDVTLTPQNGTPETITRTNTRELYYSPAQQLAHHTTSGCPMRVGDLLGSGTISGPTPDSRGSMLELSWGGQTPINVGGTPRAFLEDGDTVTFHGAAVAPDHRIGFGTCDGTILPALPNPYAS